MTFVERCSAVDVTGVRCALPAGHQGSHALPAAAPPPQPSAPSAASDASSAIIGAGIAWIICACLIGFLALTQLGFVGTILDTGSLQATAIWNFIAAAITLYFGARILTKPNVGILGSSIVWAVLTVGFQGYQIANGASHWAYVGSTVAALAAGVLSYVGRQAMPALPPMTWGDGANPSTPVSSPSQIAPSWPQPASQVAYVPQAAAEAPPPRRASNWIERLLIAAIAIVAVVAILLVGRQFLGGGSSGSAVESPTGTPATTRSPAVAGVMSPDDVALAALMKDSSAELVDILTTDLKGMTTREIRQHFQQAHDRVGNMKIKFALYTPTACTETAVSTFVAGLGTLETATQDFVDWIDDGSPGEFPNEAAFASGGSAMGRAISHIDCD